MSGLVTEGYFIKQEEAEERDRDNLWVNQDNDRGAGLDRLDSNEGELAERGD
jgi:hypothetical protein